MADHEEKPLETVKKHELEEVSPVPISTWFERQGYRGEPFPDVYGLEKEPDAGSMYKAHRIKVKTPRLKIRYQKGRDAPSYHDLINVKGNPSGMEIQLTFDCMLVEIRGKNLLDIADAIEDHVCYLIQEFHPKIWNRPAPDRPVIEEIRVSERYPASDRDDSQR